MMFSIYTCMSLDLPGIGSQHLNICGFIVEELTCMYLDFAPDIGSQHLNISGFIVEEILC